MKKTTLYAAIVAALMGATMTTSCNQTQGDTSATAADSAARVQDSIAKLPELKGDDAMNRATKFYAGMSKEGITMSDSDAAEWDKYSKDIQRLLGISQKTRTLVDSLAANDFSDFRDKIDVVFYPFSGADILYPTTIFPDAPTIVMCGLEPTGTPIGKDVKTSPAQYHAYRKALSTFLNISYFITKDMIGDMHNDQLDGVCPVISMLMATAGYDIISVENLQLSDNGTPEAVTTGNGNLLRFKFFKPGSKQEKTLYYVSADVADGRIKDGVKAFFENSVKGHTVASYLKAASYLMSQHNFSTIRNIITDNAQYLVEDDSGIPYRYLKDTYNITLYGMYKRPLAVFSSATIQPDLDTLYKQEAEAGKVKPLPFRIGYNNPSNWLCGRRK